MDKGIDASLGLEVALITLQRLRKYGVLQAEVSNVPGIRGNCRCSIEIGEGRITSCTIVDAMGKSYVVTLETIVATDKKRGPFAWNFHPRAVQPQRPQPNITQTSPAQPQKPQPNITQTSPTLQPPFSQWPHSGNTQPSPAIQGPYNQPPTPSSQQLVSYNQQPAQPQIPRQISEAISGTTVPIPLRRSSEVIWPSNLSTNEKFLLEWLLSLINGHRTVSEITSMLPRLRFEDVKNALLYLRQLGVISLMG